MNGNISSYDNVEVVQQRIISLITDAQLHDGPSHIIHATLVDHALTECPQKILLLIDLLAPTIRIMSPLCLTDMNYDILLITNIFGILDARSRFTTRNNGSLTLYKYPEF